MAAKHNRKVSHFGYEVRIQVTEKLIGYFRFRVAIPSGASDKTRMVRFATPGGVLEEPLLQVDLERNIVWCSGLDEVSGCLNFVPVQGAEETGGF